LSVDMQSCCWSFRRSAVCMGW